MTRKNKSKEARIIFPLNIAQLAENFRNQRLEKERAERALKLVQEREARRVRALRLRDGLPFAKKIFAWATAFRKSDFGPELIRKSLATADYGLIFFDAHIEGIQQWVGFGVEIDSLYLDYGDKPRARAKIKSAFDLAILVDTRILAEACEWIENWKMWECIERHFDYLKEKK